MSTGVGATIIVSVLGAISIREMTTHLGAGAFGIFVLVTSYVSLVQTFTDLGLVPVLQTDVARGDQDERLLLGRAMGLRLSLSLSAVPIAAAIGLLVYADRPTTLKIGLVLMLCSIPFAVTQEVSTAHFAAKLRVAIPTIGTLFQQVIFVGLVVVSVNLHKSITYCLGAALIGSIASSAFTNTMIRRELTFSPSFDRSVWASMLRTSTPIGVAYVVGLLYFRADTLILSFLSTTRQIGFYGVAYSIVSVFLALPGVLTRTFLPSIVRSSDDTVEESVRSALTYFSIGGCFSAAAIMICGPTVVRIVSGSHFGASDTPLRILGLGLVFIFVTTGLSSVCVARGFGKRILLMSVVSLVLNVAFNIVAIPTFGINGAATATLACEVVSLSLFVRLVRREVGVTTHVVRALLRPLAAAIFTCGVLAPIFLHHDLTILDGLILMPATVALYFGALTVLRGVPKEVVTSLRTSKLGLILRRQP
jgi:O-antigen/teichoic acid export membrane protein